MLKSSRADRILRGSGRYQLCVYLELGTFMALVSVAGLALYALSSHPAIILGRRKFSG